MALKEVRTTCAYCGAGCQITFLVDEEANKIVKATPADGRTNQGTLCLKGRYGWDYLNDPKILTKRIESPMIRKDGELVEVSWEEAIAFTAENLNRIKAQEEWEQKHKQRKSQTCGCIGISTEYYSEYDIVEFRIIERQVSKWYIVE